VKTLRIVANQPTAFFNVRTIIQAA